MCIRIEDAKWLMLVPGIIGFTVLQPSELCYPLIVSNPIVQIKVRSILKQKKIRSIFMVLYILIQPKINQNVYQTSGTQNLVII